MIGAELIRTIAKYARRQIADDRGSSVGEPAVGSFVSEFADEPEIAGILCEFVGRLAEQVEAMRAAYDGGRHEDLRRIAHRLKGAGGSYGYPCLTEAGRALEEAAKASDPHAEAAAFDSLAAVCAAVQEEYGRLACAESSE